MAKSSDPFSLVYTSLFEALRANRELATLVAVANQIRFDKLDERPELDNRTEGDLPELLLYPVGFTRAGNGGGNSSSSFAGYYALKLLLQSESKVVNDSLEGINPLLWQATLSLERATRDRGLPGMEFVRAVNYGPTAIGSGDARNLDRLPDGWYSVIDVSLHMVFSLEAYVR